MHVAFSDKRNGAWDLHGTAAVRRLCSSLISVGKQILWLYFFKILLCNFKTKLKPNIYLLTRDN